MQKPSGMGRLNIKKMEIFKENEAIIWLIIAVILMLGYWITQADFFLILSMTALLMSRIAKTEYGIKHKEE